MLLDSRTTGRKDRWLRRFVLLNAGLIAFPICLAVTAYLVLTATGMQISGSSGTLGIKLIIVATAYIALPNVLMLFLHGLMNRRRT